MSTLLAWFTDHLLTRVNGTHINPNDRALKHNPQLIDRGAAVEVANENAFNSRNLLHIGQESDLTPYGSMVKSVDNYSLFKPVTHGQFKFAKLDKFG